MKKISSKELNELSINQKLDMIMHALGIVSESKTFCGDAPIDVNKLAAHGLKEDKVSLGLNAIDAKSKDAKQDTIFIVDSAKAFEQLLERFKDNLEITAAIKRAQKKLVEGLSAEIFAKIQEEILGKTFEEVSLKEQPFKKRVEFNIELTEKAIKAIREVYQEWPEIIEALEEEIMKRQAAGSMKPPQKKEKEQNNPSKPPRHWQYIITRADGQIDIEGVNVY